MTDKREYCLRESHGLLRHYSKLLNMYDNGERVIPESLDEWVLRTARADKPHFGFEAYLMGHDKDSL